MIEEHYGIEILHDGTWIHEGRPIMRHNLVKLFASVLSRDEAGDYWLITPAERGRIKVADVPFMAVDMRIEGTGKDAVVHLRTNVDDWVRVGVDHPLRMSNAPYVMVRRGLEARLARSVYYELVAWAESLPQENGQIGFWSCGRFYALGEIT